MKLATLFEFEDEDYSKLKKALEECFDIESIKWLSDDSSNTAWWVFKTQGKDSEIYITVIPNIDSNGKEFGLSFTIGHEDNFDRFHDMSELHDDPEISKQLKDRAKTAALNKIMPEFEKVIRFKDRIKRDAKITWNNTTYRTPTLDHEMVGLDLEITKLFNAHILSALVEMVVKFP